MAAYTPLVAAIVSAFVILFGYVYEKDKEREFQDIKTQQEIYSRLLVNEASKLPHQDRLRADDRMPRQVTTENYLQVYEVIDKDQPELRELMNETREIMALLSVYGTDNAIEAVARFYKKSRASMKPGSTEAPDRGQLLLDLRRSLFPDTQVKAEDINLILSQQG